MATEHISAHPGISTLVIQQCVRFCKDNAVDMQRLYRESNFKEEWLTHPDGWLSTRLVEPLMRRGIDLIGDPLVGLHASTHITLTSFGIMGFIAQTSSTLRDLIAVSQRYERLISDIGTTLLSHEPGTSFWQWECTLSDPVLNRHATECILAVWVERMSLIRKLRPESILAVRLKHAIPDSSLLPDYEAFFGCQVLFDQEASGLIIPTSLLSEPLSLSDPTLHQTLAQHAQQLLQTRQSKNTIVEQAREALKQLLAQEVSPDREMLAKKLGMSGRNLHRKLEEESTSYRDLLDELRLQTACTALAEKELPIETIAIQTGFQESQSFIRWFKRLKGVTPGEYRAQQ